MELSLAVELDVDRIRGIGRAVEAEAHLGAADLPLGRAAEAVLRRQRVDGVVEDGREQRLADAHRRMDDIRQAAATAHDRQRERAEREHRGTERQWAAEPGVSLL